MTDYIIAAFSLFNSSCLLEIVLHLYSHTILFIFYLIMTLSERRNVVKMFWTFKSKCQQKSKKSRIQLKIQYRPYFLHWYALVPYIRQGCLFVKILASTWNGIFFNKTFKIVIIRGLAKSVHRTFWISFTLILFVWCFWNWMAAKTAYNLALKISKILLTSPIVINVPTRASLAVETKDLLFLWLAYLNNKSSVFKQISSL